MTAYENTANKLRPKSFEELSGQTFVVSTICNSIEKENIAPAYLFSGPRGVGKTSAARLVALAINRPEGTPINELHYEGSEDIRLGKALDVIEIDGASYTSVENVRNIREEIQYAPVNFKYKIYIIDEVHMLSNSAFNALLKTIEEPPEYIVFIFATTESHKVPVTIRSRCQQFSFRLISPQIITNQLKKICTEEEIQFEEAALKWIVKEAQGSFRDAYTLFDQVKAFSQNSITLESIKQHLGFSGLDTLNSLFAICLSQDRKQALSLLDELFSHGVSIEQFVLETAEYIRNLLLLKSNIHAEEMLGFSSEMFEESIYNTYTVDQLEYALSQILECYRQLRYTVDAKFEVELLISQFCELHLYLSPRKLVENLKELQKEIFSNPSHNSSSSESSTTSPSTQVNQEPSLKKLSLPQLIEKTKNTINENKKLLSENNIDPSNVQNELWERLINSVRNTDESLALVLESAAVEQEESTIYVTFTDEYGYKKYLQYADRVLAFIQKIAKKEMDLQVTLAPNTQPLQYPNTTAPPVPNVERQDMQNTIIDTEHISNNSQEISQDAKNVLDVFGGTIQDESH